MFAFANPKSLLPKTPRLLTKKTLSDVKNVLLLLNFGERVAIYTHHVTHNHKKKRKHTRCVHAHTHSYTKGFFGSIDLTKVLVVS